MCGLCEFEKKRKEIEENLSEAEGCVPPTLSLTHTHMQMGHFPRGTLLLRVIIPDHFYISNYFNHSFLHMESSP